VWAGNASRRNPIVTDYIRGDPAKGIVQRCAKEMTNFLRSGVVRRDFSDGKLRDSVGIKPPKFAWNRTRL